MNKLLKIVVLGLFIVVASVAWRRAVEHSLPNQTAQPVLVAQGGEPVPPSPWLNK